MQTTITQIADWANGAENEPFDKQYFFAPRWMDKIKSGNRTIIIGRKGTGKSAIARNIVEASGDGVLAEAVPFEAFDPARFGFPTTSASDHSALLQSARYLILRTICELCADTSKDRSVLQALEQMLGVGPLACYRDRKISDRLRRLRVDMPGFGFEIGLNQAGNLAGPAEFVENKSAALLSFIESNVFGGPYYVVFDALDSSWIEACKANQQGAYTRKIGALIAAAIELRNHFRSLGRKIHPLVFTRADIFAQIYNAKKTDWEQDCGVHLEWTQSELLALLEHRILSSARLLDHRVDVDRAFEMTFRNKTGELLLLDGQRRRSKMMAHILEYSLGRPRDVVVYMAKVARRILETKRGDRRITKDDIAQALPDYGQFLRGEIQDELGGEYPGIRRLINVLRGATNIGFAEFCDHAKKTLGATMTDGELQVLAERLFELGVILQKLPNGTPQFAIRDRHAVFDDLLPIALHPSYSRAVTTVPA